MCDYNTTDKGCKNLGLLIQESRGKLGMTAVRFLAEIEKRTKIRISPTAFNTLENGNKGTVSSQALAALAYSKLILKPNGEPYNFEELGLVLCEQIDITTGQRIPKANHSNGVK